jgi:hypothetical protein
MAELTPDLSIDGLTTGEVIGHNILGETTEALHRFILDGWNLSDRPPRIEEDLSVAPKDREEIIYIYMYRVAHNPHLKNQKRWRQAPVFLGSEPEDGGEVYYHRPPLLVDMFYLLMVHSKFRSDAERLMGWLMLRLHNATHLVYRPRRFALPDGREVDSLGRPYDINARGDDNLVMEKVSLALVDDLTVGDATNLFSLHEAPYRPFMTYRARVALDGPLAASGGGTTIKLPALENTAEKAEDRPPASGRVRPTRPGSRRMEMPGPKPHFMRRSPAEPDTED